MTGVVHGRVDGDGRLIDAEPRLRALQERAGGRIGAPLAPPGLAAAVRLAGRLGVVVSRAVIVHDDGEEIELWARARPDTGGVSLSVAGWLPRDADRGRAADVERAGAAWTLEVDAGLTVTRIGLGGAGDSVGAPLTTLVRLEEDGDGTMPILSALGRRAPFDGQRAVLRATGEALRLAGQPMLDADGALIGYRCAAEAAAASMGGAVPSTDALGRALRRPLDRILASAEGMSVERGSSYAGYADDIAGAARHLLALVDDLVDLEAVEQPDFAISGEPIDLALLGRRAAGLLAVRAAERGVRIDPPAAHEALPSMGEPRRVLQILVNLVGNAVRHSPAGGMVWLRGEVAQGQATIVVADQGTGIAAQDQARIFEKFERVEPAEPGGSGLGLYIARRLARALGGDIAVDSAPGQGARFLLTLPVGVS